METAFTISWRSVFWRPYWALFWQLSFSKAQPSGDETFKHLDEGADKIPPFNTKDMYTLLVGCDILYDYKFNFSETITVAQITISSEKLK